MKKLSKRNANTIRTSAAWKKYVLFSALLVLLSTPFLLDLNIPEMGCYRGLYRAPMAFNGPRVPDSTAVVTVSRHGVIRISNGEEMSLPVSSNDELFAVTSGIVSHFPERPFLLKIDRETKFEVVEEILSALESAGAKQVFFHTELPQG